jgi:hypothetical protein
MSHHVFGPDFVLGGVVADAKINFRFEVWARWSPLPAQVVQQVFLTWRRAHRKNVPKRNKTIQVQWLGDPVQ